MEESQSVCLQLLVSLLLVNSFYFYFSIMSYLLCPHIDVLIFIVICLKVR